MDLEALAALGLASAVVTFVDFALEITSKGKEYHKSVDGILIEHVELQSIADRFKDLSINIKQSLSDLPRAKALSNNEKALKVVAERCQNVSLELREALEKLQIPGAHRKYKSFRQALKTHWTKNKIEDRQKKLRLAKEDLAVHFLVIVRSCQLSRILQLFISELISLSSYSSPSSFPVMYK